MEQGPSATPPHLIRVARLRGADILPRRLELHPQYPGPKTWIQVLQDAEAAQPPGHRRVVQRVKAAARAAADERRRLGEPGGGGSDKGVGR